MLERAELDVVDGVGRVLALQAQQAASPYVALWNRLAPFRPADLDAAFVDGRIVKASLLRITLHAVRAEDHPPIHAAMQPTLRGRLRDKRYASEGRTPAVADEVLPELLTFLAEPRMNDEVTAWLAAHLRSPAPWMWWAQRTYGPVLHAVTGGPWSFGARPAHVAAPTPAAPTDVPHADTQLTTIVRRYLAAFGPASVADIAQFALVQRGRVKTAVAQIEASDDPLVHLAGPGGMALLDVAGATLPDPDTPAPPRLLGMWDSTLLAYHDRSRIIPESLRSEVIRRNGDSLPTLLVDGQVAGVWRTVDGRVEATALAAISDDAWEGLDVEARSLTAMLADREPDPYRRYDHWWTKGLRAVEVRVLGD